MFKPLLIKANGEVKNHPPKNGTDYTLEELQTAVGGNIEIIHLKSGHIMILNEEGKILHLKFNSVATLVYGNKNDFIVGDVLITNKNLIK